MAADLALDIDRGFAIDLLHPIEAGCPLHLLPQLELGDGGEVVEEELDGRVVADRGITGDSSGPSPLREPN